MSTTQDEQRILRLVRGQGDHMDRNKRIRRIVRGLGDLDYWIGFGGLDNEQWGAMVNAYTSAADDEKERTNRINSLGEGLFNGNNGRAANMVLRLANSVREGNDRFEDFYPRIEGGVRRVHSNNVRDMDSFAWEMLDRRRNGKPDGMKMKPDPFDDPLAPSPDVRPLKKLKEKE